MHTKPTRAPGWMHRDATAQYEAEHKRWERMGPVLRAVYPEPQPPKALDMSGARGATGKFAVIRAQEAAERQRIDDAVLAANHTVAATYESFQFRTGRSDELNMRDYIGQEQSPVLMRDRSGQPTRDRNRFDNGVMALTSTTGVDAHTAGDMVLRVDPTAYDDHRAVPQRNDGSASRTWERLVSEEYHRMQHAAAARGERLGRYAYADAGNTVALRHPELFRAHRLEARDFDDIGG